MSSRSASLDYTIHCQRDLSDDTVEELAIFAARTFSDDPIARFSFGGSYAETKALREASLRSHLRSVATTGRVYTVRTCKEASGGGDMKLLALAICVDPGHDLEDVLDSPELQCLLADLPEDQLAFRNKKLDRTQNEKISAIYPKDFVRNNLHVTDISVHEDYSRQGIGSALMSHVIRDAKGEGVEVTLETSEPANLGFYKACGLDIRGDFEVGHYRFASLPRHYLLASRLADEGKRSTVAVNHT